MFIGLKHIILHSAIGFHEMAFGTREAC